MKLKNSLIKLFHSYFLLARPGRDVERGIKKMQSIIKHYRKIPGLAESDKKRIAQLYVAQAGLIIARQAIYNQYLPYHIEATGSGPDELGGPVTEMHISF